MKKIITANHLRELIQDLGIAYAVRGQQHAQRSYSAAMQGWAQAEKDKQDQERYRIQVEDANSLISKSDIRVGYLLAEIEKYIQLLEGDE